MDNVPVNCREHEKAGQKLASMKLQFRKSDIP
jgi:hypothetical protein